MQDRRGRETRRGNGRERKMKEGFLLFLLDTVSSPHSNIDVSARCWETVEFMVNSKA